MALMVVIASCVFVGNAFSADWKYYGEFTTGTDTEEVLFYDSGSIISTNNSIKLWVKNVLKSDIEKVLKNKLVIERATKKIADGYNPPITKIYPNVANAAYLEEAVSEPSIKSKAEILYQIMCNENKLRKISGASFNKNGTRDQRFGITRWEDIAPESNADILAKIVCGSK
jgi:pyrroloquinoline quinone (PQQ) biosynthesis protein C